jgi:hypothetical protein
MAAHGPVRRVLLYGIVFGTLAFAAPPSNGLVVPLPAPGVTVATLLYADDRGGAEALLQEVHWGRFCRWYPIHRLCLRFVASPRLCERNPDHRLCADAADDHFCKKRPDHPLCDDDRFCKDRPDHPLCDDEDPPSPS